MLQHLLDLVFPPVCPGCDRMLYHGEQVICTQCRHAIPMTLQHLVPNNEARSKLYGRLDVEHVSAMCYFNKSGVVQQLVHNLKYRGQENIGDVLGRWYAAELIRAQTMPKIDVVVPVPLHPKRLRQRGYNQVTTFASAMAKGLDADFMPEILRRNRYANSQTRKNMLSRTTSGETFAACIENAQSGKHFLLVDDVITTGSTLEACGKALLQISESRLSIVCIAMSHS